jgi:HTH-type transcriptional regulator/antitoxin HigA
MDVRDAKTETETQEEGQAMTSAAVLDIEVLTPTWRELESQTHVKLRAIESERHYRAMVSFMNDLLDKVGDREKHPLMGLLDVVTAFVHDYEERNIEIPDAAPAVVLGFLIEQNNLRQSDLAEDFGSQSNVSEVLSGKREINARQARALAKRFGVSPAVFI